MTGALTALSAPIVPAPVEGASFTAVVARFNDADQNTDPMKYSATIDWGNGNTSTGMIASDPRGGFDVIGTYTYNRAGRATVTAMISDSDGDSATARTTNIVADAPISASGTTFNAVRGQAFSNVVVATIQDDNPAATKADFVASIDWGDGTTSAGSIVRDRAAGGFDVLGSHTYSATGAFAVQVSVHDGGRKTVATQFYTPISLISDGAVPADHIDPNLVNPWGIVSSAASPWWINDNGTGVSQLDDGAGNSIAFLPFVTVPPADGGTETSPPTGIVVQDNVAHPNDFVVSQNGHSGPSVFIFATEDGSISGWNPGVNFSTAILGPQSTPAGAVYKGLALMSVPSGSTLPAGQYLFASDFHNDAVDVYDSGFNLVNLPQGAFQDPTIPAGFAPFGIQALNGNLYVSYAKQDADRHDDVAGPGNGFVDVFTPGGFFIQRIGGTGVQPELNSPWGMTKAPANFGKFSNDLLVGNFGDSHVSAFDPVTGMFLGQLSNAKGNPLVLDGGFGGKHTGGLWGISFGNGTGSGPKNTLYFASGIDDESHGVFGSVTANSVSTATASSIASVVPGGGGFLFGVVGGGSGSGDSSDNGHGHRKGH